MNERLSSPLARRTATGLSALMAANAASFLLLPEVHHAHHERLGLSPTFERRLPALMGGMSLALVATRKHARPRALVGAMVAGYYVWASSELARIGENVLAAYGLAVASAAGSLITPAVTRRHSTAPSAET